MHRRNFLIVITTALGFRPVAAASAKVAGTTCPSPWNGQPVPSPSPPVPSPSPKGISSLESWLLLPIQPVWDRPDLHITDQPDDFYLPLEIINACRTGTPLILRYHGGSTPGEVRTLTPALVFLKLHPGRSEHPATQPIPDPATQPNYLLAWCHTRQAHRTFRVDGLSSPSSSLDIPLP